MSGPRIWNSAYWLQTLSALFACCVLVSLPGYAQERTEAHPWQWLRPGALGDRAAPPRGDDLPTQEGVPAPTRKQERGHDGTPHHKADQHLRQMVGQMLLFGFPGRHAGEQWTNRVQDLLRNGMIGGIIIFSENVESRPQLKALIDNLVSRAVPRSIVCVDQEGGSIQRLSPSKGFVGLPSAKEISQLHLNAAFEAYRESARELSGVGINCNFGPVVDLEINKSNPAIGRLGRSYGRDPMKVTAYAKAFVSAFHQSGILTCAKHFPGHGSAKLDPHRNRVDIANTWSEDELIPFANLSADVDMVMIGHLQHPLFSDGSLPASLSATTVEKLRKAYRFRGLIVSDDLEMGAIKDQFSLEEAAILAIKAGTDVLVVSNTKNPDPLAPDRIIDAVVSAVARGQLSEDAIKLSYQRIMQVKQSLSNNERRVHD